MEIKRIDMEFSVCKVAELFISALFLLLKMITGNSSSLGAAIIGLLVRGINSSLIVLGLKPGKGEKHKHSRSFCRIRRRCTLVIKPIILAEKAKHRRKEG